MVKKNEEKATEGEIVSEKVEVKHVSNRKGGRFFLGAVFLFLGGILIFENFFPEINFWQNFWPIVLILFGFSLIAKSAK